MDTIYKLSTPSLFIEQHIDAVMTNAMDRNDAASSSYINIDPSNPPYWPAEAFSLTPEEVARLKAMLNQHPNFDIGSLASQSADSDYPGFTESTHAWAIFADDPKKRAGTWDRLVGTLIIAFQLFTYWIFAKEAIEDYQDGQVPIFVTHWGCTAMNEEPDGNFMCEAQTTDRVDSFVAFSMLGIFLTGDLLQAFRVLRLAPWGNPFLFATLAALEVVTAWIAASIAVSYNLYIGEVTDAVEVGVGLLFIRELSQRAYAGIREGKTKQYRIFFALLTFLVVAGMLMDPLCEYLFATVTHY